MTLFATGLALHKFKKDKLLRRLGSAPEDRLRNAARNILAETGDSVSDPDSMLGTLGHGSHFAEFLSVKKIEDAENCEKLGIRKNDVLLLILKLELRIVKSEIKGILCLLAMEALKPELKKPVRVIYFAACGYRHSEDA